MNLMKEISKHYLKIVEYEKRLFDLDLLMNLFNETKKKKRIDEIIDQLSQDSQCDYIQNKQNQFDSILNKQQIHLEQLNQILFQIQNQFQYLTNSTI